MSLLVGVAILAQPDDDAAPIDTADLPTSTTAPVPDPYPTTGETAPPEEPNSIDLSVIGVASDDTLNVRAGAGVDNEIVANLRHDAAAISHPGQVEFVGEEQWWEIIGAQGEAGWVNRRFLVVRTTLDSDSAMADRLLAEAATAMEFIAAVNDPVPLFDDLPAFSASVEIGGIGVFADAPSPFTAVTTRFDNTRTYDFDPFPVEAIECGADCDLTVGDFLDVRDRDLSDAMYTLGPDVGDPLVSLQDWTGHDEAFFERYVTVVTETPAASDEVLDWRRYTFVFDFEDGTPQIRGILAMGLDAVVAGTAPKPRTGPSNAPGRGLSASQFEFGGIRWWSGDELEVFDETEASGKHGSFELELRSSPAVGSRQWRCDVRGGVAKIGRLRTHEAHVEQGPTSD